MNLEDKRKSLNMSIYKLSKKSGVSQPYLKDIELGTKSPTLRTLQKIADALGITVNELIGDNSENSYKTVI